jgi:hypothetical protein
MCHRAADVSAVRPVQWTWVGADKQGRFHSSSDIASLRVESIAGSLQTRRVVLTYCYWTVSHTGQP